VIEIPRIIHIFATKLNMENSSKKIIVQKFLRKIEDNYAMAEKYYSVLSTVNGLKLTQREIQLVAFTAIRGNISYSSIREDFCKKYNSTSPTINNIISKLKRIGVFVKDGSKIKVNPVIILNFSNDITLEIKMEHNE
jgi:molybdenum cofactor biosynthesis enzyme MoaA